MNNLEKRIKKIETRNVRVELDKKWETSWTRRTLIVVLTFLVVLCYNLLISASNNVVLNSLVPVLGFVLSTFSIDAARKIWEKALKSKEEK
jgi:ABC-type multidrug transport system fused ATPase/permease subunit